MELFNLREEEAEDLIAILGQAKITEEAQSRKSGCQEVSLEGGEGERISKSIEAVRK